MARHSMRKGLGQLFQDEKPLGESDPEFIEMFNRFAYDNVAKHGSLDDRQRSVAVLSSLMGCGAVEEYGVMAKVALRVGVAPAELKELIYQAVAVLGMGPVLPFLSVVNELLESKNVKLPLQRQPVGKGDDAAVADVQGATSGAHVSTDSAPVSGDDANPRFEQLRVWEDDYLYRGCYSSRALELPLRELSTFCLLAALDNVDAELERSMHANVTIGNDEDFLSDALLQCAPYMGFPRVRHALACMGRFQR
ncbi:MAG: carboxymuconolactone decarboxylase family protein [Bifidobacterium crudilactis]|nr:carboxymuconolactone decarboxylase family protein [Bifidobacterium crudilactis]MCI1889751.1 carboxymuconolactone decarboxylase family protein [Bifidobacterium crudilactis]